MLETTRYNLSKRLFFFALPIIGSLLTQQLYGVADMIVVGQLLGANELAAVGNASSVTLLFIVISGGIELAIEIIFSRYLGKNDQLGIARGTLSVLLFSLIVGILLALVGYITLPLLFEMIKTPADLLPLTKTYSFIYLIGVPFIYVYDISRAMITSLGDSKKSFFLILISSVLNVLLNSIFIAVFHLGVAGAALGTILSQGLLMLVSVKLLVVKSKENPYFSYSVTLNWQQIKEIGMIAIPSIFQQFVITLSLVFLQAFVNPFGKEIIIGYVAITKVLVVSNIVIAGFGQTLSIFSAQMLAGEDYSDLQQTYRFLTKVALLYASAVSLIFFIFPEQLCRFFFDTAAHVSGYQFFKHYLMISIIAVFMGIFKQMNENLLRSALKMKQYLICNIGDLLLKISATYLLIPLITTQSFAWAGIIGRLFALIFSFYYVYHLQKEINCSLFLKI